MAKDMRICSGRMQLYRPEHPQAHHDGWILRARLVAEQTAGRLLTSHEVVHHIDRNPLNDDPANLLICPSHKAHGQLHAREDRMAHRTKPKRPAAERKIAVIQIRLRTDQKDLLAEKAQRVGLGLSSYLLSVGLAAARGELVANADKGEQS